MDEPAGKATDDESAIKNDFVPERFALLPRATIVNEITAAVAWSTVSGPGRVTHAQARARAHACARAAEASHEALRRAAGGVEKAARLAQQARAIERRREDARLESTAEELAAARWAARRADRG